MGNGTYVNISIFISARVLHYPLPNFLFSGTNMILKGCSAGALASQIWGNELVQRFNYPKRTAIVADSYLGVFPGNNVEGEIIFDFGICSLSFLSADFKEVCLAKTASTADFVTTAMQSQPHLPYLFLQSRNVQ